mmetsp:Transcript_10182/g.46655  ORF Transcript_10182/g.46655 Transcript_10182/m.46655 type:complete len:245 (-) Transcript_10182:813-1547(-)
MSLVLLELLVELRDGHGVAVQPVFAEVLERSSLLRLHLLQEHQRLRHQYLTLRRVRLHGLCNSSSGSFLLGLIDERIRWVDGHHTELVFESLLNVGLGVGEAAQLLLVHDVDTRDGAHLVVSRVRLFLVGERFPPGTPESLGDVQHCLLGLGNRQRVGPGLEVGAVVDELLAKVRLRQATVHVLVLALVVHLGLLENLLSVIQGGAQIVVSLLGVLQNFHDPHQLGVDLLQLSLPHLDVALRRG